MPRATFQIDDPRDPMAFEPILTPTERSIAANARCYLEDRRRRLNEADARRQAEADAAELARLGVEWLG